MVSNYFKTAWRNLVRSKTFSAINILGLALGMACSLLIMLWVGDEYSVDSFHASGGQLYQVYERNYANGKVEASYLTQGLLATALKKAIPEIRYSSGLERNAPYPYTLRAGDKIIKINGSYAGTDFFAMFSYPFLQGNAQTALSNPMGIAISRKMAEEFFGNPQTAMGKTIRFENKEDLSVTAVFEDLPANSSVQFDFLRSWESYVKNNSWLNSWNSASPFTLIQLRKDADPEKVEAKIKDLIGSYVPQTKESHTELALQAYPEKYLHSTFKNGQIDGGRIEYVRLFSLIAVFILLIACINFMNLATARSTKRAREIGVRKVIGASRLALIGQFIGEALMLTFFSLAIAMLLAAALLPGFNSLTGKHLFLPVAQPLFWMSLSGLLLLTGIVAGSYPALFLSSLNPIRVLKGSLKLSGGATSFRKGLVVFQFTLSIILIVGMIVIYRQMDYVQTKNLGYDRENLVYLPIEGDLIKNYDLFKQEASKIAGIRNISKMKESPTLIGHSNGDVRWEGKDPRVNSPVADAAVGYDFVKTMRLELAEGRDFSKDFNDSSSYLVNEAAAKKMGYMHPVGQPLWWGDRKGKIVGELKDFHFNSLHEAIEPLVIRMDESQKWGTILVRIEAGKTRVAIAGLERICKAINPNYSFTYQFSDQEYSNLYKSEQIVGKLSDYFAFLAIFISCLGLFGLATFTAEQRTKEIGLRKVLGASTSELVGTLAINFLKPVGIAMVIAFPLAWYAMDLYLLDFAYKIDLGWQIFAGAGLTTLIIALITVSFHALRTATANPVKSLRAE